ncbi:ATP-binding protein [Actinoplanes sp. NPDC051346]|uniref:ATP-binding protein n=1 Tax=Actinoplanes sp. NPDC051346 TaxID=3155048 RepID=UPI00342DBC4D
MADPGEARTPRRANPLTRDFDLATLVALRHDVQRWAQRHGLTDLALYRFVVAVNEITTNAVRHGGGRGCIELWRVGDRLHCRVTDQGPGLPADRHRADRPGPQAVGGRGLWLASAGIDDLTIDTGGHGTKITLSCLAS